MGRLAAATELLRRAAIAVVALVLVASAASEYSLHLCHHRQVTKSCVCHGTEAEAQANDQLERGTCCSAEHIRVEYAAGEAVRSGPDLCPVHAMALTTRPPATCSGVPCKVSRALLAWDGHDPPVPILRLKVALLI